MIYLQLFLSFLQVGMFSIGGGYAAIPLIRDQIVTSHTWLTMNEFTDLITIAEMTPGPIAVNSATFVASVLPASGCRRRHIGLYYAFASHCFSAGLYLLSI